MELQQQHRRRQRTEAAEITARIKMRNISSSCSTTVAKLLLAVHTANTTTTYQYEPDLSTKRSNSNSIVNPHS